MPNVQAKGSNTTKHMREHHPIIYAEIAPKAPKQSSSAQTSLSDVISKSTKYSPSSAQSKELNRAVTYYLAKDAVPLSTVDKPGFRHMVSILAISYHQGSTSQTKKFLSSIRMWEILS